MTASVSSTPPALESQPIPAKILIADDEPRNLLAVSEILSAPGVEIVLVESGEEVLRRILREDFAVILLDVRMPRIDGYEVAAMVRARTRSARVPILFMTAYNKDELHVFRGYSAGAVDYVFKPIEPVILKSKVDVFVDLFRKTEELKRQHSAERELLLENLRVRSEKLDAERALRRGEEHQSLVLRGLPIALYKTALDQPARILYFTSENIERISGFPSSAFEQSGFWETRVHDEDRERALHELRATANGGTATVEYRWLRADGTERHIMDQAVLVRDEHDAPRELFGMWFDVSERKELEYRLLHASKLEAVGRLTGGIAHDFNNMLNIVIGNLDLLQTTVKGNDKAVRRVENAIQGAQRCADLTSRLLAFSRRSPLQAAVFRPGELMPGIIELLRRTLGERIGVTLDLADDLPAIRVDRSQFEAALVNLAVNARDAMPEGGALHVRVRYEGPDQQSVEPELGHVEISIADTGTGMPQAVLDRVFEPFFTTKETGKGTGLGLSMVYGFIQQSGGDVAIESASGQGTTIRISLPAVADRTDAADEPAPLASSERLDGRSQMVLVVEDDPAVRRVAASTLESLGFRVSEAETGEQAISVLETDASIRLVFSDVKMPGRMTGVELGRVVKRRWPATGLLLVTGFVEEGEDLSEFDVLQKPYRTSELIEKLRCVEALAKAQASPGHQA